jgi:predicted Ser/Thr protein kinase/SAM-dependent methyltransferase
MVKVVAQAIDPTRGYRVNDLEQEADILRRLAGVRGVPSFAFLEVGSEWQALGTTYVDGTDLADRKLPLFTIARVVSSVTRLVIQMSLRGLSHNDIKPENVLLSPDGRQIWLIDFDQATTGHTRWRALVRNMIGSHFYRNEVVVHGSLRTLLRSFMRRRALARQRQMPPQSRAVTPQQKTLYKAWQVAQTSDANAPGDFVAYYALNFEGLELPGERSWEDRWEVLRGITDFKDKRVLELGCNMGLLSVYLRKFAGASEGWGVDHDESIVQSARLVADAFAEPSIRWSVVDLADDIEAVDELVAFNSDIITCLNVWNWVPDRALLSRLLASAPEIIFEGHEAADVETARLRSLGFEDVGLVTVTERGRPLLHGRKSKEGLQK